MRDQSQFYPSGRSRLHSPVQAQPAPVGPSPEELAILMEQSAAQAQLQNWADPRYAPRHSPFDGFVPGHPSGAMPPMPTMGNSGYYYDIPQNAPPPQMAPQGAGGPGVGPGQMSYSTQPPAYRPATYTIPEYPGLPDPRYLPQLMGDQSIQQAMALPQFQQLVLPQLSGAELMGFTPEMVNSMVGYVTQANQMQNEQAQRQFTNKGTQIEMARGLDNNDLHRKMQDYSARATHTSTMRGQQEFQNYETPETQRVRGFEYNKALRGVDYDFSRALMEEKANYTTMLDGLKSSNDMALKKEFEIHETNVKNFLAGMDLADVKRLYEGKLDIATLMANPSFKLLTENQKNSIVASLRFFQKYGVAPETLIGAHSADQLLNPGRQTSPWNANSSDPLGWR